MTVDPERELRWLRLMRSLARRLSTERDVLSLLPKVVDAAIELTRAERGFLVRIHGRTRAGKPRLKVEAARGFSRETLQGGLTKVSRTVVETVLERGTGLVTSREEDAFVRNVTSVRRREVLAIACVPMTLRGELRGVLYLDHRFDEAAFGEEDLPVLEAFAEQAALALESAELTAAVVDQRHQLSSTHQELEAVRAARQLTADAAGRLPAADALPRFGGLIGASPAMQALYAEVERASRSLAPVLIQGETGTGKELVARELHRRGAAAQADAEAPFCAENCAALPEGVLESELFGHVQGAFTGADRDKPGLFQLAGEGTLFLDEVADTSRGMQAKLLRALQEGRVRRVGADRDEAVHCRVIAACHADLREAVDAGSFREDLYYRLDVLRLAVPPLRERAEDVPALLAHFVAAEGRPGLRVDPAAMELLLRYPWPGNVRELENEARRLVALEVDAVAPGHLSPELRGERRRRATATAAKTLPQVEAEMVRKALARHDGNKTRAAKELGVPKTTLYRMIERHGLG